MKSKYIALSKMVFKAASRNNIVFNIFLMFMMSMKMLHQVPLLSNTCDITKQCYYLSVTHQNGTSSVKADDTRSTSYSVKCDTNVEEYNDVYDDDTVTSTPVI